MTEKIIKKILEDLSKGTTGSTIITRPLNEVVDYAKVWPEATLLTAVTEPLPLTCYFIRLPKEGYIGAVIPVETSLYWYLAATHRKPAVLAEPLRTVILPHVLQHKPIQRLTLSKAEVGDRGYQFGKKVAEDAGFRLSREETGICRYVIDASSKKEMPFIAGINTGITTDRLQAINADIDSITGRLQQIKIELELKNGASIRSEELGDIINGIIDFNKCIA